MVLATLDSRNLLFTESAQAIYELDDFSAHVWRSMTLGMTRAEMIDELIEAGVPSEEARKAVAAAADKLSAIDTSCEDSDVSPAHQAPERQRPATLELAGIGVRLNLSEFLLPEVDAAFGHLKCDLPFSQAELSASVIDEKVQVHVREGASYECTRSQFLPLLKAWLIENVLRLATYDVALHAAALVRDGDALLLLGSPGAGKTTLGTYLLGNGFKVAADDVVLIRDRGVATGLPIPITVKEGSWAMLAQQFPELETNPIYCRPDGIRVRYLHGEELAHRGACRVRCVIQLDRQDRASATLNPVSPVEVLESLIKEAEARDSRLTARGFTALVSALKDVNCFRLTYSDLQPAGQALASLHP